jgi:hypothetical protein
MNTTRVGIAPTHFCTKLNWMMLMQFSNQQLLEKRWFRAHLQPLLDISHLTHIVPFRPFRDRAAAPTLNSNEAQEFCHGFEGRH